MNRLVTADLLNRVRDRLVHEGVGMPTPQTVAAALRAEAGSVLGDRELLQALRLLQTELTGAGVLTPLLADPEVTDVLVTGPDRVWVDNGRGLQQANGVRFTDEAAVRRLAQRLALVAGRRLDDAQPWVDGRLPGPVGTGAIRLHAVLAPIAQSGTCISLRVLRPTRHDIAALVRAGTITSEAESLIHRIVTARLAFLITGSTGAGKTTMLSALLGSIPAIERIVCVEDAAELEPGHPHVVRLVARKPNVEGVGAVTVRDLVRQALRMRPDRIVVGEVRGPEVIDLLTALNTGHEGGAGTVHANSPRELPARLEALAALGELNRSALHSLLAAAVRVVLHMHRRADGSRTLSEIGVVQRACDGRVEVLPAWRPDKTGQAADVLERMLTKGEQ